MTSLFRNHQQRNEKVVDEVQKCVLHLISRSLSIGAGTALTAFEERIRTREATIAVVGLGYTGLPLAIAFAEAGFEVTGIDVSSARVDAVRQGHSYLVDVPTNRYAAAQGRLTAVLPSAGPAHADATVICVPTRLSPDGSPDMTQIANATRYVAERLSQDELVVLQSSTYPGTTEEVLLPVLSRNADCTVGEGFYLGYAPERVDPGNAVWTIRTIPRLVAGVTPECLERTRALFATVTDDVVAVSSPRVAEAAKLYENAFRAVNIGLANELALMCEGLDVSAREVIDAAASKPFGFMPHYPGPGLGGECIPVVPQFLAWKSRQHGYSPRIIDAAVDINESMPGHVCHRVRSALATLGREIRDSRVLLLGMAYKPGVGDHRGSAGVRVHRLLQGEGALVTFCDPEVNEVMIGRATCRAAPWSADQVRAADCVVMLTAHQAFLARPYYEAARTVVDTQGVVRRVTAVWRI